MKRMKMARLYNLRSKFVDFPTILLFYRTSLDKIHSILISRNQPPSAIRIVKAKRLIIKSTNKEEKNSRTRQVDISCVN